MRVGVYTENRILDGSIEVKLVRADMDAQMESCVCKLDAIESLRVQEGLELTLKDMDIVIIDPHGNQECWDIVKRVINTHPEIYFYLFMANPKTREHFKGHRAANLAYIIGESQEIFLEHPAAYLWSFHQGD